MPCSIVPSGRGPRSGLARSDRLTVTPTVRRSPVASVARCSSIAEAVDGASVVIEALPERLELKASAYIEVEAAAPADALLVSSTSGLRPTSAPGVARHPERLVVGHPFNPVYLLPLVEVVGGEQTASTAIERAMSFFRALHMEPLHVRVEIDAFIADRLLEAVWREALWLVNDGVATTGEIDDAIRYGFGLRWAQMGLFETYRVAGGEGGMAHFIAQFGETLNWPWTKLMDTPELTPELVAEIGEQSDAQSGHLSIAELEDARDQNLVAILAALAGNEWGAGQVVNRARRRASARPRGARFRGRPVPTRSIASNGPVGKTLSQMWANAAKPR